MRSVNLTKVLMAFGPVFRRVPLSRCVDATGARFSAALVPGFVGADQCGSVPALHPYTRRLLSGDDSTVTGKPEGSSAPGNAAEAIVLTDLFPELAVTPPDHPAHSLPADTHLTPWFDGDIDEQIAKTRRVLSREFPEVENPVNPVFGTMGDHQRAIEEQRLQGIYHSIRESGFHQDRRRDDPIQGVFLTRSDGDARFLVMAGKHRVAALAAVRANGNEETDTNRFPSVVWVRLRRPGVVRKRDVDRWPLVATGFWPREAAIAYLDRLFRGIDTNER